MRRRYGLLTVAVALVVGAANPVTAAATPPEDIPPSVSDGGGAVPIGSSTVTLITGDRVRLDVMDDGTQRAAVVAPSGLSYRYHTRTTGGETYLVPSAAEPLLAAGRLDRELFNVTSLVAQGYDDAHSDVLPLITTYPGPELVSSRAPAGSTTTATLGSVNGAALAEDKSAASEFWAAVAGTDPPRSGEHPSLAGGVTKIWLDARTHATLDESVPMIGGPGAWARGLDGTGATVAVLDTGIDPTHPDFGDRIAASQDFTGSGDPVDHAGHGTHVSSTVAGSGAASDGRYRGVAPGADLMVGKVLGDQGVGTASWAIEGMEWAASHGADIVNLSLGGPVTRGEDPMSQAVNALTDQYGTLFVIAAGNKSGPGVPGSMEVTSPGTAERALTVGAVSKRGFMWSGSRHGLMADSSAFKPELVAPGVAITAARADGTGVGDGAYATMTGTSMAAPHVTGVAALLAQQHPDWDADELRAALTSTATPTPERADAHVRGAGLVNADRATAQSVFTDTGVLDMGYFAQPFDPDTAVVHKTVTYRNESDSPVTLNLSSALSARSGDPAGDGVLTVSPDTLALAPGASGTVEVTVDATTTPADVYTGRIVATGEGAELSTTVGFYKQDYLVDVTFSANDLNGNPAQATVFVSQYKHADHPYFAEPYYLDPAQTEWTLKLPAGNYDVQALIITYDESGRFPVDESIVGEPQLGVRAPNFAVHLDARDAVPVNLATPKPSEPGALGLTWRRGANDDPNASVNNWAWTFTTGRPIRVSVAPTEPVDDAPFMFATSFDATPPKLEARWNGDELNLTYSSGPQVDGYHRYRVVDAGDGTDTTGLDLSGALALVRETDGIRFPDQVRAVTEAGAAAVVLYSSRPGAFWPRGGASPVPVMALPKDQGEALADWAKGHHRSRLRVVGQPRSPYAYDVIFPHPGQVPADQSYQVDQEDLATVHTNLHTTGTGEKGWRLILAHIAECDCGSFALQDYVPSIGYDRTEYVTAQPGVTYSTSWQYQVGLPGNLVYLRSPASYSPGQQVSDDWLEAPLSPGPSNANLGRLGEVTSRFGDRMSYSVAGMTDSAGHWTSYMTGTNTSSALYQGDTVLYQTDRLLRGSAEVPTDSGPYRLVADTDHDGSVIALSTRTHSEWTFTSAGNGDTQVMPLVDVDYTGVRSAFGGHDMLNIENEAPALLPVRLTLRAGHQLGSNAPEVNSMRVWVSYDDGEHWRAAPSWRTGSGEFTAAYIHPPKSWTSGYVSLRVAASDSAGNALDQTIIRAYKLRDLFPFDPPRVEAE